ncbi:hypothetical protein B0H10DRAFT_217876 [Mycena sp. CBHHK59/15]|nr:hypothetical protein B0H10DRAFT_217876 [Mycena sp. CBHHK59/15]
MAKKYYVIGTGNSGWKSSTRAWSWLAACSCQWPPWAKSGQHVLIRGRIGLNVAQCIREGVSEIVDGFGMELRMRNFGWGSHVPRDVRVRCRFFRSKSKTRRHTHCNSVPGPYLTPPPHRRTLSPLLRGAASYNYPKLGGDVLPQWNIEWLTRT